MASQKYKAFGITVFEIEYDFDAEEQYIQQNGGMFERDTDVLSVDGEEPWDEEDKFGFG